MNLLLDIGGTKTRIAVSKNLDKLDAVKVIPTNKNYKKFLSEVKQIADGFCKKYKAVCAGVPSSVSKIGIIQPPNLKNFRGKNIKNDLEKIFNFEKIFVLNDTQLSCIAEAKTESHTVSLNDSSPSFDKSQSYSIEESLLYITVSTGIGSSFFKSIQNTSNTEIGKTVVVKDSNYIFIENLISGTAKKNYKDKNLYLENLHKYLSLGLHNFLIANKVDVVVFGGGVGTSGKLKTSLIKKQLNKIKYNYQIPKLKISTLGDTNGVLGAMYYLKKYEL